jgi:hypothetical protein
MKVYQDREFQSFDNHPRTVPWGTPRSLEGLRFENCQILSCSVYSARDPRRRPLIRNIELINCEVRATMDGAVVEDVVVDTLKTPRMFGCFGCVFKHVVVRGKIGTVMLSPLIDPGEVQKSAVRETYAAANAAYYATVDWAIDIREAAFQDADLHGVPGHLVRRDPATQFLITREKALQGEWRTLDLSDTYWPATLDGFLSHSDIASCVLVAPKRNRKFQTLLDGLKKLRDAGVAEPD